MADTELKDCPFCGGAVELERTTGAYEKMHGQREWWGVVCRNTVNVGGTCAIQQVPSASKEAAVERWNRRSTSSVSEGEALQTARNALTLLARNLVPHNPRAVAAGALEAMGAALSRAATKATAPAEDAREEVQDEPVGEIVAGDPVHGWHMRALVPWSEIGAGTKLYRRASSVPAIPGTGGEKEWISVHEKLPEVGVLVMVYSPPTQYDHPGEVNIAFDCVDPNDDDHASWLGHNEHYEHFCCVAKPEGSIGPSEKAPYTHWMPLPTAPSHPLEAKAGEDA